jgi:lipopolysaccharide biosynthesis protein
MSSFVDAFRAWRRDLKARMPYVRRREYRILRQRFDELVEGLGWTALPATQARIATLRPLAALDAGEVCFFVSFAPVPRLKHHVTHHIEHLLRAGIQVVLVLNTELSADAFDLDPSLTDRLAGVFVRENTGFDFAAWAHLHSMCVSTSKWTRLYLVNDSIVGPLRTQDFDAMVLRIRASSADVVALTESQLPLPHLQSFFMALNSPALRNEAVKRFFQRVVSLPTKGQVIDVYETRLTQMLTRQGLRCEAVFAPLSNDPHSSNDTSFRWASLIRAGFPYIKTSIIERHRGDPEVRALVPTELLAGER